MVRAEVIRRFPFLIVDELQDTGHFLGKSIRLLLEEPAARGLLVGDPDQAIYEFSGARPDLFDTFESIIGAVRLSLASSQRCPSAVACAAMHLKDSGGVMGAVQDRAGRARLVRYGDIVVDVAKVVEAVRASCTTGIIKVVARGTATVDELVGRHTELAPNLYCAPLTHIHRAVVHSGEVGTSRHWRPPKRLWIVLPSSTNTSTTRSSLLPGLTRSDGKRSPSDASSRSMQSCRRGLCLNGTRRPARRSRRRSGALVWPRSRHS